MDTIDKLFAMEEIKALKARYFRYVDTKDWKGFEEFVHGGRSLRHLRGIFFVLIVECCSLFGAERIYSRQRCRSRSHWNLDLKELAK
jgi:hypothetical protein